MDNLTHTLVGAAMGQAGLKRASGLAMPALMIAANIPDVDIAFAFAGHGLSGRRGWTHGPVGLLVLPVLLTGALVLFDRWQARRGRRPTARAPVRALPLLLVCYAGALSHPLLDLANSWGIRLLMPFSERWFYGDALFIADPWIWLALAAGIWLSRRREAGGAASHTRPAAAALAAVLLYGGAMAVGGRAVEARAAQMARDAGWGVPRRVLANPVLVNPFRREIVVDTGGRYGFGAFDLLASPQLTLEPGLMPVRTGDPAVASARRTDRAAADFLGWSRYPLADIRPGRDGTIVALGDARFTRRAGEGAIGTTVTIPHSQEKSRP